MVDATYHAFPAPRLLWSWYLMRVAARDGREILRMQT
jgi:hypothetical protein